MKARKWSLAARKRISAALKKYHATKNSTSIVHTPELKVKHKVTIPQGVRDMDSIVQRADRMSPHGLMFLIGELTRMLAIKSQPVE